MDDREGSIALDAPGAAPLAGTRPMSRWRAAGVHLLISAAVASVVLLVMLAAWYPPPLFTAMGGIGLTLILVGVDVVLGPALTLVVFRSGKPGLKLDLALIGACQVAALLYGCYVVSLARPAFIVFVKDQFQVATMAELEPQALAQARHAEFRKAPWTGPLLVYGEWPKDHAEQQRMLAANLGGIDLQHLPRYYAPYEQGRDEILRRALPIARARVREPAAAKAIDEWLAGSGHAEDRLLYVPLRGRNSWVAVLIDRTTARPVKMLLAEPI